MALVYPSLFPCAMIDGYQIDVDSGVIRSAERGLPAQRRTFTTMPQSIKCKFSLSLKEWGYWQEWMTREAKNWFTIDLVSMYTGPTGKRTSPHLVRLMSTVTIDTRTNTHVTASVTLEVAPSMLIKYLEAI